MDNFEKQMASQIKNDKLDFSTDAAIHSRLMYHMQLKSTKSEVRKNSFLPALVILASGKFLTLKLGVLGVFLMLFLGYNQLNQQTSYIQLSDSVNVSTAMDTTFMNIEDSLRIN